RTKRPSNENSASYRLPSRCHGRNTSIEQSFARDLSLLAEFEALWGDARKLWDRHEDSAGFGEYVSADYAQVCQSLIELRGQATTFLEWGSGLGVVAIMASRLGFEAYGIEAEAELVEHA
ncbi:MAG: hypothetical protein GTO41_02680, partial [Burkholderiales bacterium]|nr:hypothetical protein [Burkholderiales bacterium]